MPANLPPQYYELERAYRAERDPREKLRMAEELLRIMPKHKGTDKLQAEMKAKISRHRKEIEGHGTTKGGGPTKAAAKDHIEKEGAAQVILIGAPNAGKSSLVDALTHAQPLVADYPYSTRDPLAGMMEFETVHIQLIDTPPISHESFENYLTSLIRNADLVVLVCDLEAKAMLDDLKFIVGTLEEKRIILVPEVVHEPEDPRFSYKKTILCTHKEYEDEDGAKRASLAEMFPGFASVATSIIDDDSLRSFGRTVFNALGVMRIYTKRVGHEVELVDPIILPIGGTVMEAAVALHKDFAQKLKFAKVWGEGKFDGQKVQNDFVLSDRDIVEFHI